MGSCTAKRSSHDSQSRCGDHRRTKQDLYDIITECRRKNPRARIPETAFPAPYLLTETENKIIDDILPLLNKNGLTSHQSINLGSTPISRTVELSVVPSVVPPRSWIVMPLDVVKDIGSSLGSRLVVLPIQAFPFADTKEALGSGIVSAIPHRTHAGGHVVRL